MNRIMLIAGTSIVITVLLPLAVGTEKERKSNEQNRQKLIGSWEVTSAQTSLILSIEADHKVLVLWIRKGSHSMLRTSWKPFHGGILVQALPRIRLWPGRENNDDELRAELEAVPEIGYDPNKEFHERFFMRRIKYAEPPKQFLDRPVPEQWKRETLDAEWNASAGKRRPASASMPSQWLQNCVVEMVRSQTNEVRSFNGIGANDVALIPENNVVEDILQRCQNISRLSKADIPFYRNWLKDRISEIQAITLGTPRARVDQLLLQNGGLSTRFAAIYSHRDCLVLKVRVQFDGNGQVKAISPPYLGLCTAD